MAEIKLIHTTKPIYAGGYSSYRADIFPEILLEYMKRYGYSPHDMAMFFRLVQHKVKEETIQKWLYGETVPSFQNQLILAQILNVSCGTIFAAVKRRKDV